MTQIITKDHTGSLLRYNSVRVWLRNKGPDTQYKYLRFLARLTMQTEDTPNGILRLAKRNKPEALAELVDDFAGDYPVSQVSSCKSALRGFFLANGCTLPSKTEKKRVDQFNSLEIKRELEGPIVGLDPREGGWIAQRKISKTIGNGRKACQCCGGSIGLVRVGLFLWSRCRKCGVSEYLHEGTFMEFDKVRGTARRYSVSHRDIMKLFQDQIGP